ncbi:MAG: hypothetical protein IT437_01045, partial [Phycisphaerales bacterium]|nr:hypothetical protein [Phycisphaerales bacterium]
DWDLDLLGNWRARVMAAGGASTVTEAHETDARNRIDTLTRTVGAGSPQSVDVRYDAAGNLSFDGTHVFQCDVWNRLLQVNRGHLGTEVPPSLCQ